MDITFVGNATTIISAGGVTLLTDPNFLHQGQHAYLGYGLLSKRLREPAIDIDELPPLDAVVLSHMHGDHWDRVAQTRLDRDLPILTTPHAAKRLRRRGFGRALGMQTWQRHNIISGPTNVTVTSLPGRHAPAPVHRALPPVMGSMVEVWRDGETPRRLYVSGDTLLVEELDEIPRRFSAIDAGIMHLGGTRLPFGKHLPIGLTVTMDGAQGARAVEMLDLDRVIPVHYDDYGVFASPLSAFVDEMKKRGMGERIVEVGRGETVTV
jgi:L-ascorbate metabolism protein UlaG (beta-lactamase superfamily)